MHFIWFSLRNWPKSRISASQVKKIINIKFYISPNQTRMRNTLNCHETRCALVLTSFPAHFQKTFSSPNCQQPEFPKVWLLEVCHPPLVVLVSLVFFHCGDVEAATVGGECPSGADSWKDAVCIHMQFASSLGRASLKPYLVSTCSLLAV